MGEGLTDQPTNGLAVAAITSATPTSRVSSSKAPLACGLCRLAGVTLQKEQTDFPNHVQVPLMTQADSSRAWTCEDLQKFSPIVTTQMPFTRPQEVIRQIS